VNDLEAKNLVAEQAPKLTLIESQFVRTIGRLETRYARGWKDNKDIPGAVGDPITSRNWGAITTTGEPFFTYMDGFPVKEVRRFKVYPSDGFGIRDLSRELYVRRPGLLAAVQAGDGERAVKIMKETKYFEAPIEKYLEAAQNNYNAIVKNTGEPRLLSFSNDSDFGITELGILGVLGYGIWKFRQ
jgi:hypothetical protein